MEKKKSDVHGTVPIVIHITVEAENGEESIKITTKKFKGVPEYVGNGGYNKLISIEGSNEFITIDGDVEFDDWTDH